MTSADLAPKFVEAGTSFNEHEKRGDGPRVASSLDAGLSVLRGAFYRRLHDDVERFVGKDSMLMPLSERQAETATTREIEIYQIAESHVAAQGLGCVCTRDDWYLRWLARLRLGALQADAAPSEQAAAYVAQQPDARRLTFTDVLARVLPESRRAPLVLFQLFPLSVHLATVLAFGDSAGACKLRQRQVTVLPAIADCRQCRGRVLESGETCRACGNPLWKTDWLRAD